MSPANRFSLLQHKALLHNPNSSIIWLEMNPRGEYMQGIYRIYDIDTGITYVGKSKNIHNRWRAHANQFNN